MTDATDIQRAYYDATASRYDQLHLGDEEHEVALAWMISAIRHYGLRSALDVGSGTGRGLLALKTAEPELMIHGIEPSAGLRARALQKGIDKLMLTDGDVQRLPYNAGAFDIVCAFGVLHHVPNPRKAVSEMLRVARRAVFISDANNFGQGRPLTRLAKQSIHRLGLWPLVDFIKTRGKGYLISEEDGLAYSYSVFDDYAAVTAQCDPVYLQNTKGSGPNLYRSASHIAMLGIKRCDVHPP